MENESDLKYRGWRVAIGAASCVFVSFASLLVYTFGIFLKPLAAEFHWSREAVSSAFGIAALAVAACSPLIGALLDRVPARRIFIPCLVVFGCAFASLSLLTNRIWHLYAVFLVLGVVGNGTAQLAYSRTVSTWFEQRRGSAFALLMCGGAVGAIVLPLAAQFLIGEFGWRMAFAGLGCAVLIIGLPAGSLVRERTGPNGSIAEASAGATIAEALRSWPFWLLVLVLFALSIGQNASIAHLAALLTDRGIAADKAAWAVSVLGAATLAGRLLTGWLLDRCFAPRVAFCLISSAAVGTYVLAVTRTSAAGLAAAALIGIGLGGEADVTPYLLSKYFGLRSFGTLYGLSWTAYAIAGAIGPVIMGRSFDSTGSYQVLLAWLSPLTVAAACAMLLLPAYERRATGAEPAGGLLTAQTESE